MNRIILLGTGTSNGIPVVGCECETCRSENPCDQRLRVCALLQTRRDDQEPWESLLLDTSIDLRRQLLKAGSPPVWRIAYTHAHMDHFFGLDELRPMQFKTREPILIHGAPDVIEHVQIVYAHLFDPSTQQGGGILQAQLFPVSERFDCAPFSLQPLPVLHGRLPIFGYRWGDLAYITDCSFIPETTWPLLEGVHTLVLGALRHRPHETHFCLEQAVEVAQRLNVQQAFFIHMTHNLPHAQTNQSLPAHIQLGYDGQVIDLSDFDPLEWLAPV